MPACDGVQVTAYNDVKKVKRVAIGMTRVSRSARELRQDESELSAP